MAVLELFVTEHRLELFHRQSEGGEVMVCSCGWDSGAVDHETARSMGRMHLREDKELPFHGAWLQTSTHRDRTNRRYRFLRRGGSQYASYFGWKNTVRAF